MGLRNVDELRLLKYIYAYMLERVPIEKTGVFWKEHPLADSFSTARTIDMLCRGEGRVTYEYYYSVLNDFSALADGVLLPSDALEQVFRLSQTALPLSSEELLSAVAPFAEDLYLSEDIYYDIYELISPMVSKTLFPGFTCRIVDRRLSLPHRTIFLLMGQNENEYTSFAGIADYMGVMLGLLPVCFSLPEAVSVEAETCCGETFGASGFLFSVKYDGSSLVSKTHLLSKLIDSAEHEPDPLDKVFSRHQKVLDKHKSVLVYRSESGRLTRNGKLVARDTTAYILNMILSFCKLERRCEFENREFMKDPNIVSDPLNSNLVVKLNRAFSAAEKKIPEIKVTRTTRGAFRIDEVSPFDYKLE